MACKATINRLEHESPHGKYNSSLFLGIVVGLPVAAAQLLNGPPTPAGELRLATCYAGWSSLWELMGNCITS